MAELNLNLKRKKMIEIYLDVETTGLSAHRNGIWQLAFIMYYKGEEVETFKRNIAPMPMDTPDKKALDFNNLTEEQVRGFSDPIKCFKDVVSILDKYIDKFDKKEKAYFYGYNARFDMDFMRAFFEKNGNKFIGSYFWFPPIDVMNTAMLHLIKDRPSMENFQQSTVAEKMGIQVDSEKLHDALYDLKLTKQIQEICLTANK